MAATTRTQERVRFPRSLVAAVVGLSFAPFLFRLAGARVSSTDGGWLVPYALLEWTSFCLATFAVVFALVHYAIKRDVATPIVAAALCFTGLFDAFRVLAFTGLTENVAHLERFVPFTWALARTYGALILVLGAVPFVWRPRSALRASRRVRLRYLIGFGLLFGVMAFAIVRLCARQPLPQTLFPGRVVTRPWDAGPLVLYMLAGGIVLPRFWRMHPGLFSYGLMLGAIPNVVAETHLAFGASRVWDVDVLSALLLKNLAYAVPLCGLVLDYLRMHEVDVALRTTQEKLHLARRLQQGLLPEAPPRLPGLDVDGRSAPTDAVGGDYYDYLTPDEGTLGVVVADVSGHELAAAIVLAQTRAYLRSIVEDHPQPADALRELNRFLCGDVQGRWFVTLFYACIATESGELRYAAAGHEGLLLRADGRTDTLPATGPPLGVDEQASIACGEPYRLEAGDVLAVTTDGLAEARNPAGQQFGTERIVSCLRSGGDEDAGRLVTRLCDAVVRFRGSERQSDDETAVVVRRRT